MNHSVVKLELSVSLSFSAEEMRDDPKTFKRWLFDYYREEIIHAARIQFTEEEEKQDVTFDLRNLEPPTVGVNLGPLQQHSVRSLNSFESDIDEGEIYFHKKRLDLLDKIAVVQSHFLKSDGPKIVYSCLMDGILELMQSEFGFIGETKYDEKGNMSLQTHATTTVGWEQETVQYFKQHPGVTFTNMDSLMGRVLTTKKALICNDVEFLQQLSLPGGHPAITSFLGIPLSVGGKIIGNICIANKRGTKAQYTEKDIEFLEPFAVTGCNLIQAYREVERNRLLIDTLEEKVNERTIKLATANRELETAKERVEQASRLQLQHFACMSHEIRTPLNCIIGLSSLLLESELDTAQRDSMQMIVNSGEVLLTVVNDVLDYSKLETGNVDIDIKKSSLQETLNSVVNAIETKATSRSIRINTQFGCTVPEYIFTDSRRLQQILYNLLGNAVKFRGNVDLTVKIERPVEPNTLGVNVLRFSVKDYGQGIDEKDFAQIFLPFRQASAETERVFGGTGLGLAVTSRLVKNLGGSISVRSELGKWAEFIVDFPMLHKIPDDIDCYTETFKAMIVFMVTSTKGQISHVFQSFGTEHYEVTCMSSLEDQISSCLNGLRAQRSRPQIVCLVQEDLFCPGMFERLKQILPLHLSTFGPKYSVKKTERHFRSLTNVLPSVLMKSLAELVCVQLRSKSDSSLGGLALRSLGVFKVPLRDIRVLVAEDNRVNQKVIEKMLRRIGTESIEIVDDGQKAVHREANTSYDIILMDMQMPVMDGVAACREILGRENGRPKPKIIFVTAHAAGDYEEECMNAGASGFITKPFNMNEITNALMACIE